MKRQPETMLGLFAAFRNVARIIAAYVATFKLESDVLAVLQIQAYDFEYNTTSVDVMRLKDARQVWEHLTEGRHAPTFAEIAGLKTFDEIMEHITDSFDDGARWETEKEYNKRESEKNRRHLEKLASQIAIEANCSVDSLEFIAACERKLEAYSDYRQGMREDGLCIGYGVTVEQWYDECNASYGDSATVEDILAWLSSECPLLWAKHQEAKKEEKAAE